MTRRIVIAAVVALSMGTLSLLAQGPGGQRPGGPGRGPGGPGGRGGPGGPGGIMAMVHQLDLTDAQREQLRSLMEDRRQGGEPGGPIRAAEQKLHAAVLAETPDLQAIESLKAVLTAAHAAELEHRIERMQKVAQILTPSQKQQLLKPKGRNLARM